MPHVRRGRYRREDLQEEEGLLRLQQIPRVRVRDLGQADNKALPQVRWPAWRAPLPGQDDGLPMHQLRLRLRAVPHPQEEDRGGTVGVGSES